MTFSQYLFDFDDFWRFSYYEMFWNSDFFEETDFEMFQLEKWDIFSVDYLSDTNNIPAWNANLVLVIEERVWEWKVEEAH